MKKITFKSRFLHDFERMRDALGRDFEIETFVYVTELLAAGEAIPLNLQPHALSDEWTGYSEFHLDFDWLVVYQDRGDEIVFWRSGTHLELFGGSQS